MPSCLLRMACCQGSSHATHDTDQTGAPAGRAEACACMHACSARVAPAGHGTGHRQAQLQMAMPRHATSCGYKNRQRLSNSCGPVGLPIRRGMMCACTYGLALICGHTLACMAPRDSMQRAAHGPCSHATTCAGVRCVRQAGAPKQHADGRAAQLDGARHHYQHIVTITERMEPVAARIKVERPARPHWRGVHHAAQSVPPPTMRSCRM